MKRVLQRWLERVVVGGVVALLSGGYATGQVAAEERPTLLNRRSALVEMVAEAKQAVVFIQCNGTRAVRQQDFFGRARTSSQRFQSSGSGVVIFSEGYVVTNYHVVEGATEIEVLFDDDRAFHAVLLSFQPEEDLALLRIDVEDVEFPVIPLADDEVYLAETVVAIGNPHGRTHTVSRGIVSGLHRDVTAQSMGRTLQLEGLIQTDAAINTGNSGGPLLNVHGELIGINTVMEVNAENIGFAIPVTRVRRVLNDYLLPEAQRFASLGFEVEPGTLRVASVVPGGPAQDGDVRINDRIVALGNKRLASPEDWSLARAAVQPGTKVGLVVVRNEQELPRTVLSWNRIDAYAFERFGARVEPLRSQFPVRGGMTTRLLLRIAQVRPESPAAVLGLAVGDLIDSVEVVGTRHGAFEFRQEQDFPLLLTRLPKEAELVLNVWRDRDGDGSLDRTTELYAGRLTLQ